MVRGLRTLVDGLATEVEYSCCLRFGPICSYLELSEISRLHYYNPMKWVMAKPCSKSITTPNNDRPSTKSEWNYHPHVPIDNNPLFSWPIGWKDTLTYYRDSWLVASEGTIFVLLAVLSWQFFSPEIVAAQKLDWSWVGGIWLRNFIALLGIAGTLHYYFFAKKNKEQR